MSHYPSSAELAAFRRTLSEATGNADPRFPGTVPALQHPHSYDRTAREHESGSHLPVNRGGAWLHEREHGIGYRIKRDNDLGIAFDRLTIAQEARREANRMRRAAFDRMARHAVRIHDTAALIAAIETFNRPAVCTIAELDRESVPMR